MMQFRAGSGERTMRLEEAFARRRRREATINLELARGFAALLHYRFVGTLSCRLRIFGADMRSDSESRLTWYLLNGDVNREQPSPTRIWSLPSCGVST